MFLTIVAKLKVIEPLSVVICLVWKIRSLAAGMGVGVRSMLTGSFGRGGLMLQDPTPTP